MVARTDLNPTAKFASGLDVLLGLWLVLAPWLLGYAGTRAAWNDILVGIAIALLAAIKTARPVQPGPAWAGVGLGAWLILAPFVLGYGIDVVPGANHALWNDVTVGIFVVVLSWISATIITRPERHP